MLVELRLVERRHQAVLEVLNEGTTVTTSPAATAWLARRFTVG